MDEKDKTALNKLILEYLPNKDGEQIMTTIAESYRQEGVQQGMQLEKLEIAKLMLFKDKSIAEIKEFTGLAENTILQLKIKQP